MATLTLTNQYDDWPPDVLEGDAITARSATAMTYSSAINGFSVTLRGTGLAYDADGLPASGTITRVIVTGPGGTYSDFAGVSADFAIAGLRIFGFDRDNGNSNGPDPFGFFLGLMRANDLVTGGLQDDDIRAGRGHDTIRAGDGDDYVGDEHGNDLMNGGDGFDSLSYDEANWRDEAFRGVNLDAATGKANDCFGTTDTFSNFERFKDSHFSDTLKGSAADEQFVLNRGSDVVDGRGGYDRLSYEETVRWGAHHGVNVNLATGIAIDSWNSTDRVSNIEELRGSVFDDTLVGSGREEVFLGGLGVDVVRGGAGHDQLSFGNVDNFDGHGVVVNLNRAVNVIDDGFGNSETVTGIERWRGSDFDDLFTGGAGEDDFDGTSGNDTLIGGGGTDHLSGSQGNDVLTGNAGADDFNFGTDLGDGGVDVITDMQSGIDEIWIGSWWGGLTGDALLANQFRAGAGATTATTANHRVIYNTTTGDLYFDADGAGGGGAIRFADLGNRETISFDDFRVFL